MTLLSVNLSFSRVIVKQVCHTLSITGQLAKSWKINLRCRGGASLADLD